MYLELLALLLLSAMLWDRFTPCALRGAPHSSVSALSGSFLAAAARRPPASRSTFQDWDGRMRVGQLGQVPQRLPAIRRQAHGPRVRARAPPTRVGSADHARRVFVWLGVPVYSLLTSLRVCCAIARA